jgi:membrane associated rhomboid family serine protease
MFPLKDDVPSRSFPWITWALIIANGLAFLHELNLSDEALQAFLMKYGMVSARLHADPGTAWTILTSMFLHAGWVHILGNMWFLHLFGDNVEDRIGHLKYLGFYVLCGIVAAFTQYAVDNTSQVPCIGASGAIAGVLGAYLLLFPRAQVLTLVPIFITVRIVHIPAVVFLGLWFVMQLFEGTLALGAAEASQGVAFWAHVGGFCAGMMLTLIVKKRGAAYRAWHADEYRGR